MGKWKMVRLGDIVHILNGFAFKSNNYSDRGIRVIRITNVQKGFIEDLQPQFYPVGEANEKYHLFENDLLISLTGNVGRVAIISKTYLPAALNQRVACLRIKNELYADKMYIFSLLNSVFFEKDCIRFSKGVAQKNMSTDWLKQYKIPLPPLDEQKRIAKNLDLASEIVKGFKEQLAELDKLVQSVFYEMFGDPVTNEKGWEISNLLALGELNRGVSKHRPRNAPELLGGNYPLIQTGDISNSGLHITKYSSTYSDIGLKQSRLWNAGTLCITIAANIAQTAILAFDACFPDSVVGFISGERTNQIFMHTWFGFFQRILEEQASQVAQKNINLKILGDLDVIVPPLPLQTRFASIVIEIEAQKVQAQLALKEAENLFNSLMQEYFE